MEQENKIQYKTMSIKAESDDKREFSAMITDETIDRDHEVLLATGMNKKDFLKNGIILFNHNPDEPIGTATSLRRSGDGWKATGRIAEGVQKAEEVWQLLKQGILKAVSVGFRVDEQRLPTKKDVAEFGKEVINVISKWTLYEISLVAVGANQNALVLATKDMSITAKEILGDNFVEEVVDNKEGEEEKIKNIEEVIEKELEGIKVDIKEDTKDKIVEIVKEKKLDIDLVMKYFRDEVAKQIRKSKGNLF